MNKYLYCIFAMLIVFLEGCVSNQPKLSSQELAEKRQATLNIYEDNRVAVRVLMPSTLGSSLASLAWNDNKDEALVYSTGKEYYNAKDLIRIVQDTKSDVMTAFLKDGTKKSFYKKDFGVFWCTKGKVCSSNNSGSTRTIFEEYLREQSGQNPKYVRDNIQTGSAVKPYMMGNEIVTLDDAGRDDLEKRLSDLTERWAAQELELAKKREKEKAAAKARDTETRQQAVKAGQVNCTSTTYNCVGVGGSYSDATLLNCGSFNSTVEKMREDGWVVANINPEWVRATLGVMCDHNVYHFHYKR